MTDTSVVLNLCLRHREELLAALYREVLAPDEVRAEFQRLAATDPPFRGLCFSHVVTVASPIAIPGSLRSNPALDAGEIAALALALERGIRDVLIDERAGRAVARSLGLTPSGLLGILIELWAPGHAVACHLY